MDTDLLKNFIVVAHYLNMTKAAEFRNISPSAVSKKITALEHELGGVTLMQRYPGRLYLTEEGQVVLAHAEKILRGIESIQSLMAEPTAALAGPLTIHTMRGLGLEWFSEQLPEFRELYPDIALNVLFDGLKPFALASQNSGVYAGLSTREPVGDSIYIWKRLASFYFYPYAHQSYLEKQGTPTAFDQLDHHKIIRCEDGEQYSQDRDSFFNSLNYLGTKQPRTGEMKVDDLLALKTLVENGAGVGMMPAYMESPGLVRLFDGLYDPKRDSEECHLYYVYPSYIKNYRRVTVLKNHLVNKLQGNTHFHNIVVG